MDQVYLDIYKAVWSELFPGNEPMEIEKFKSIFTADIKLPEKYLSEVSQQEVYNLKDYGYKRFISNDELMKRALDDDFVVNKEEITDLQTLIGKIKGIATFRGSRVLNSEVVADSDNVYSSSYVFNSAEITSSQKVVFSNGCSSSEYLVACRGDGNSSFSMRLFDSGNCSNSFEVHWSGKCSNCYFCSDSMDLRDCMFCFHMKSKQFCIGNMQFEEAEYRSLKDKLLKEYLAELDNPSGFKLLKDL